MTHARTALVATDAPARYAKQLASHLGRRMSVTQTDRGPELAMAFDEGTATCRLDATADDRLGLHVEGSSGPAADRMADVVGSHLERFGERAGLEVHWTA